MNIVYLNTPIFANFSSFLIFLTSTYLSTNNYQYIADELVTAGSIRRHYKRVHKNVFDIERVQKRKRESEPSITAPEKRIKVNHGAFIDWCVKQLAINNRSSCPSPAERCGITGRWCGSTWRGASATFWPGSCSPSCLTLGRGRTVRSWPAVHGVLRDNDHSSWHDRHEG